MAGMLPCQPKNHPTRHKFIPQDKFIHLVGSFSVENTALALRGFHGIKKTSQIRVIRVIRA